jgi:ABC-type microcin C transport system permease subunit YejE
MMISKLSVELQLRTKQVHISKFVGICQQSVTGYSCAIIIMTLKRVVERISAQTKFFLSCAESCLQSEEANKK